VSSDGAVPVHFKVDDGNVGDPTTNIETWKLLRQLVGGPEFMYVADCKLCTGDNLRFIDGEHGSFITVLPSNRKEDGWFREWVASHDAPWQVITSIARSGQKEPDLIQALESPIPEVNGFRLIWFRSSEKCRRDADIRHDATARAIKALEMLAEKLLKPRCRLKKTKRALFFDSKNILAPLTQWQQGLPGLQTQKKPAFLAPSPIWRPMNCVSQNQSMWLPSSVPDSSPFDSAREGTGVPAVHAAASAV